MRKQETITGMTFFDFVDAIRIIFDQPECNLKELLDKIQQARYAEKVMEITRKVTEEMQNEKARKKGKK